MLVQRWPCPWSVEWPPSHCAGRPIRYRASLDLDNWYCGAIVYDMDTIQKALEVIGQAETELRKLISEALSKQRYGDVREIAQLADRLAHLAPSYKTELSDYEPELIGAAEVAPREKVPAKRSMTVRKRAPASIRGPKRTYPRFVRDGERLVKVGWSKKNRQEYEHRVPKPGVQAFVRHLATSVKPGRVFDIESLLPATDQAGVEVPGYQVYVVVAWLRAEALIEKKGRDGYVIDDTDGLEAKVEHLWSSLEAK